MSSHAKIRQLDADVVHAIRRNFQFVKKYTIKSRFPENSTSKLLLFLFLITLFYTKSQVEKSDSCQYLQTAEYRASCKQRAMPVLESWYRAESWRGTGIVQPQS